MRGRFLHDELKRSRRLLELNAAALRRYNQRELDTESVFVDAIDRAIASFSEVNNSAKVGQLESLKAEFITCEGGVNPYTLEKISVGRRALRRNVTFKILQAMETLLRCEFDEITAQLEEANLTIQQIVLSALQAGLLTSAQLQAAQTQADLESIWSVLRQDSALALAQKKVLLAVNYYDAIILLDAIVTTLCATCGGAVAPSGVAGIVAKHAVAKE